MPKQSLFQLAVILALAIFYAQASHADRDIVYSARYYYPPGTKTDTTNTRSRFHLYRINPDGSGKTQVTNGRFDDSAPVWSVDGRHIYFQRSSNNAEGSAAAEQLCRCDPDGGHLVSLIGGKGYLFYGSSILGAHSSSSLLKRTIEYFHRRASTGVSPDIISEDINERVRQDELRVRSPFDGRAILKIDGKWTLIDPHRKRRQLNLNPNWPVFWWKRDVVLQVDVSEGGHLPLYSYDLNHADKPLRDLKINVSADRVLGDGPWRFKYLTTMPGNPSAIMAIRDVGMSGMRPYNEYMEIDVPTNKRTEWAIGQFVAWNKARTKFLTSDNRATDNYDGKRTVYVAALNVRDAKSKEWKPIVSGKVWVGSGDWRFGGRLL